MKKFSFRLFSLISLAFVGATALTVAIVKGQGAVSNDGTGDPGYSFELDEWTVPDFTEDEYGREGTLVNAFEKGDYALTLKYRLGKNEAGYHVTLAPHGYMYNEVDNSTHKNKITGLSSIIVNYESTADISIRTSIRDDGKEFGAPQTVEDGVAVEFNDSPYYFIIEAGDAEAHITSIKFNYSCQAHTSVILSTLSGTYTGQGDDGYTYKLCLNGSSASIESLNKSSNVSFSGTAEIVNSNQIKCTLDVSGYTGHYISTVSNDHSKFTFSSKDGAAASFPQIDFYKVYKVEDFERFSSQGAGFGGSGRGADSVYSMSGLRSQWHADFYSNSASYDYSYFHTKEDAYKYTWRLMGSTDYLSYVSNKGHNNSKAAVFKGNSNGLRYIQMKAPLGVPSMIGQGAFLSFWAKPCTNATLTTSKTTDTTIQVNAFYKSSLAASEYGTYRNNVNVTIPGNSDWTRYVIPLDTSKTYYAFGFYDNKTSTQVYLGIDDVEIFTVNPYAPVVPTSISVDPTALNLEVGHNSTISASFAPIDCTEKSVTWTTSNSSVATVSSSGVVTAVGAGNATITATSVNSLTATCSVTVAEPAASPYPEGTYMGLAKVNGSNFEIVIALGTRSNGMVAVRLSNSDAVATGITYNDSTQQFTITTTGSYSSMSYGNITGTYDDANDQLINVACSGGISSYVSNNGSITATKLDVWDCDGTTSQLQSTFKRRYMSGSWQVDNSNADRITSNTEQFVSGTGSVKRRGYSGGAVALNFNSDFSPAKTAANVQFWVYNPSGSDITLRMWGYKAASFGNNFETGSVTAKAGQWTYVAMGFTSASIYNFQIADFNNTGVYLSFDNIALF